MKAVVLCVLLAPLAAQTTHVVDATGSPGSFPTLAAALQAASHGDVISVQPTGVYDFGVSTGLGVTIVGAGPGPTLFFGTLTVDGLPANERFAMRHLDGSVAASGGSVAIWQCQGLAVIDDVVVHGTVGAQNLGIGLSVSSSPQVAVNDCICIGDRWGATVQGSTFSAAASVFAAVTGTPTVGVAAMGGQLHLTNCIAYGTSVGIEMSSFNGLPSTVTVAGGRAIGALAGVTLFPTCSLRTDGAAVVGGVLQPSWPGTPGIVTAVEVGRVTNQFTLQNAAASFAGPAGDFGVLILALPTPPIATPLGTLWCDPQGILAVSSGTVPLQTSIAIPPGLPQSFVLVSQGALLHNGAFLLSGPAHSLLR